MTLKYDIDVTETESDLKNRLYYCYSMLGDQYNAANSDSDED
jgi:hypothetical protein